MKCASVSSPGTSLPIAADGDLGLQHAVAVVTGAAGGVGRWPYSAEPGEIAEVVRFLSSERSRYMTGANLPVDGGDAAR